MKHNISKDSFAEMELSYLLAASTGKRMLVESEFPYDKNKFVVYFGGAITEQRFETGSLSEAISIYNEE